MKLTYNEDCFTITLNGVIVINHSKDNPCLYVGTGNSNFDMYRGNFEITDQLQSRIPLSRFMIEEDEFTYRIKLSNTKCMKEHVTLSIIKDNNLIKQEILIDSTYNESNRYWVRLVSRANEKYYGCGEQLSYFNLKGRNFPLWSSEPGVGRDKSTYVTFLADVKDKAGGDYYTTNYPEPTFVSNLKYLVHLNCSAYMDFNFKNDEYVELEAWSKPESIILSEATSFIALFNNIKEIFGTQPPLPSWVYEGAILGIQGGTKRVLDILETSKQYGIDVSALWTQDWQGINITSFGKRLFWNWAWSKELYPNLDKEIVKLRADGVRLMGYINPYLSNQGELYQEALKKGYFATDSNGGEYLVDFGEFDCGVVDFTNPRAYEWYKQLIKTNLIEFGLSGWMADFGEYLPTDLKLFNSINPEIMHNAWPALWAKCNYEAIEECGKLDDVTFFMRAGFTSSQKYCPVLWAGDQSVDFSLHDGLASVIPAALSAGMIGNGVHHSDVGGYTSLHGTIRTPELFMRWVEMAIFTPMVRTHEGNRPNENFQFYNSPSAMNHFAKMMKVYKSLKPYLIDLINDNTTKGIPVQRPMFVHYEDDAKAYDLQYQYMYGSDMIVAPVHQANQETWDCYLPSGEWIHMSTGECFIGNQHVSVKSSIGMPVAFYKKESQYLDLFKEAQAILVNA